jgi:hypothetical protein
VATIFFRKLSFCQCKFEKKFAKKMKIKIKITKLSKPQKWKQEPCWARGCQLWHRIELWKQQDYM